MSCLKVFHTHHIYQRFQSQRFQSLLIDMEHSDLEVRSVASCSAKSSVTSNASMVAAKARARLRLPWLVRRSQRKKLK